MAATPSITPDKLLRLIGTPSCPAIVDVRTGEDAAAFPPRFPAPSGAYTTSSSLGRRICRPGGGRRLRPWRRDQRRRRRLAARRGRRGRDARRRRRGLGRRRPSRRARGQPAAARRARPHPLGDARPAQGRPHRLSLADPPLRRPRRHTFLFVPPAEVEGVAGRSARLRSTSTASTGAIAATCAPSTSWSNCSA